MPAPEPLAHSLFTSVTELNARTEVFDDPARPESHSEGPFVVVHDGFYPDPNQIRDLALAQRYFQYSPPLPEQTGEKGAVERGRPAWMASSLLRYRGKTVASPHRGHRHASPEVRQAIARIVGEDVSTKTWHEAGDWWNGAFHVQYGTWCEERSIHHHYKEGDVVPRGWSGVVYLSPQAPPDAGTTIWRERRTGRCVATRGATFELDTAKFDLALQIENRFNRLLLMREHVLHRAGYGFGDTLDTGRLTQTFFFQSERSTSPRTR